MINRRIQLLIQPVRLNYKLYYEKIRKEHLIYPTLEVARSKSYWYMCLLQWIEIV